MLTVGQAKRERYDKADDYIGACDNITDQWREAFNALTEEQLAVAVPIIHKNHFADIDIAVSDPVVYEVLQFYQIQRPDH